MEKLVAEELDRATKNSNLKTDATAGSLYIDRCVYDVMLLWLQFLCIYRLPHDMQNNPALNCTGINNPTGVSLPIEEHLGTGSC